LAGVVDATGVGGLATVADGELVGTGARVAVVAKESLGGRGAGTSFRTIANPSALAATASATMAQTRAGRFGGARIGSIWVRDAAVRLFMAPGLARVAAINAAGVGAGRSLGERTTESGDAPARTPAAMANASLISRALEKRWSGSRFAALENHTSRLLGSPRSANNGSGAVHTCKTRSTSDTPANAFCPVTIVYAMMAAE
jgi:hypothetical protein